MSASPCRGDLFASRSLEASGEKMQSSFSSSRTSLTKTRQTRNHIHIQWCCSYNTKSSPGVLSLLPDIFFLSGHPYSAVRAAHSWKWSTLLLGAFPAFWCISQKFLKDPFFTRIDHKTDKSQGSTELLQKHLREGNTGPLNEPLSSCATAMTWRAEAATAAPFPGSTVAGNVSLDNSPAVLCRKGSLNSTHICRIITTQVHSKMHSASAESTFLKTCNPGLFSSFPLYESPNFGCFRFQHWTQCSSTPGSSEHSGLRPQITHQELVFPDSTWLLVRPNALRCAI